MADVSAAAAAMGLPEALVERSAEARAAASGTSVDDLLAAWAGGEAPPAAAQGDDAPPAAEEAPAPAEKEEPAPEPREESQPPVIDIDVPERPAPAAAGTGYERPPVLVGAGDNPMIVVAGAVGLFLLIVLVGLVGPSLPIDTAGARSSNIEFSPTAQDGQELYLSTGCAACHTQMVRPIVADVGLGPVTLDDTDQVLGTTRFGPDLSDVGARMTGGEIEATIGGLGSHPVYRLAPEDIESLVAYLTESKLSPRTEEGS